MLIAQLELQGFCPSLNFQLGRARLSARVLSPTLTVNCTTSSSPRKLHSLPRLAIPSSLNIRPSQPLPYRPKVHLQPFISIHLQISTCLLSPTSSQSSLSPLSAQRFHRQPAMAPSAATPGSSRAEAPAPTSQLLPLATGPREHRRATILTHPTAHAG
ncbi:hypothetical protein BD289DRAFT_151494 [Coniella lustricola]|uniref:Uncharacterized protein n=1 Tax=Coniella lustricola TaxID=2025994 RepID=A0A2T2ZUQ1_9PEZI|nr:hypothetical protein BD289DRAFT_151494 [Coniella lustricola]